MLQYRNARILELSSSVRTDYWTLVVNFRVGHLALSLFLFNQERDKNFVAINWTFVALGNNTVKWTKLGQNVLLVKPKEQRREACIQLLVLCFIAELEQQSETIIKE